MLQNALQGVEFRYLLAPPVWSLSVASRCWYIIMYMYLFTFPKFTGDFIAAQKPKGVCLFYDLDYLKKLESTVKKASAYLDKANASSWWNSWIYEAQHNTVPSEPRDLIGNLYSIVNVCICLHDLDFQTVGDWILNT